MDKRVGAGVSIDSWPLPEKGDHVDFWRDTGVDVSERQSFCHEMSQAISQSPNNYWLKLLLKTDSFLHRPELCLRMELRPGEPERLVTTKLVTIVIACLDTAALELQTNIAQGNLISLE